MDERVVSIGFLTAHDLALLGEGFDRHFPIDNEDMFADLIAQLDKIPSRVGVDVALSQHGKSKTRF